MTTKLINRVKETQPQVASQFEKVIKRKQLTHAYLIEHLDSTVSYDFSL